MYTYSGATSCELTHAANSRPSRTVMRQSISTAPPSPLIRVEVDGGQVAWPTACSKPGTALGIGLGSTTNTSNSRLIASSGGDDLSGARGASCCYLPVIRQLLYGAAPCSRIHGSASVVEIAASPASSARPSLCGPWANMCAACGTPLAASAEASR